MSNINFGVDLHSFCHYFILIFHGFVFIMIGGNAAITIETIPDKWSGRLMPPASN